MAKSDLNLGGAVVDPAPGPDEAGPSDVARNPRGLATLFANLRVGRFSGIFIFAAIVVTFGLWVPETFLTTITFKSILQTQAITALLALGLLFPLSAGVFDLSVAQNVGFSAMICGYLMIDQDAPMVVAIILTLACGAVIGAFNGALVAVVGLNSFIATLGTQSLLIAAVQFIGDGNYIGPFDESFTDLAAGDVLGIPRLAIYMLVAAVIIWYVLEHTPYGRKLHASGANRDAARLAGIRTTQYVFWSLVVCAVTASCAGVLLAATLNSVAESIGPQYLLPAFAAAFLGATQLKPGRFNVWGTVLAVYLLGTGVQGLQLVGGRVWVTNVFNGAALITAVSAAVVVERLKGRRERARVLRGLD